jgi:hypothetical protein
MRVKINRLGAIAATLLCLTTTSAGQSNARYKELPKFHEINAGLYHGAQPKAGGLKRLAQLGIKRSLICVPPETVDALRSGKRTG